jgi:hypothetical protein
MRYPGVSQESRQWWAGAFRHLRKTLGREKAYNTWRAFRGPVITEPEKGRDMREYRRKANG